MKKNISVEQIKKSGDISVPWQVGSVKAVLTAQLYFQIAEQFEEKLKNIAEEFIVDNRLQLKDAYQHGTKLVVCGSMSNMPGIPECVYSFFKEFYQSVSYIPNSFLIHVI